VKRFTNKNIFKEKRKKIISICIAVIFIVIGFGCYEWKKSIINDKYMDNLGTIILKNQDMEDRLTYIYVNEIPLKFAVNSNNDDAYYFVFDEKYMYVAYMKNSDYEKLNKKDINKNPIKIMGVTKRPVDGVKELAIDVYNNYIITDDSNKIDMDDYNNYFGDVYLDTTVSYNEGVGIPFTLEITFFILGGFILLLSSFSYVKFNKNIKELNDDAVKILDKEMNDDSAIYYSKFHLYLTSNYIVIMSNSFSYFKYSDVLWIYTRFIKRNGVKQSKYMRIVLKNMKCYDICNVNTLFKKGKVLYDEVWESIVDKNNNILVGYTNDNINKVKEIKNKGI
jgi:hypothetical protein